jgi:hypothetical protein
VDNQSWCGRHILELLSNVILVANRFISNGS